METLKQKAGKNGKPKLSGGITVKLMLVMFSFVQAHWVPIACAAGTVAAAAMFGDKAYMARLIRESETMLKDGNSKNAAVFLKSKIAEYDTWRQGNPNDTKLTDNYLPNLYFQLARAQELAGASADQLAENYKKAVFSANVGHAFNWLHENLPSTEYKKSVTDYIESTLDGTPKRFDGSSIAEQFEEIDNWPAFRDFARVAFEGAEKPVEYARTFEQGLSKNGVWLKKYMDYCKSKHGLVDYYFEKDYNLAEQYKQQENFAEAAEVYESILKVSSNERYTSQLKLTLCETLLNAGQYQKTISKLDALISEYKSSNRLLVKDATLLKGRAYIQLGEIGKATDEFFTLMIEYPETKQAPEANFFIGYCYMLQGKFDQAKEALNLVAKDYPQSSYASKAKLCLARIEGMTE